MFHDLSKTAARRIRIREQLPLEHPGVLDEVDALLDGLPDPEHLNAEQRAGSMAAAAALGNRLAAWLTSLADTADAHGDSRVLPAGTTGMLVATATSANPASGSAIVARARALRDLPAVAQAYAAGQLSSAHVAVITGALGHLPSLPEYEQAIAEAAALTEPGEVARMLNMLIGQDNPPHPDAVLAKQRNRRGINLTENADGRYRITGWLDHLEGTRLRLAARWNDRPVQFGPFCAQDVTPTCTSAGTPSPSTPTASPRSTPPPGHHPDRTAAPPPTEPRTPSQHSGPTRRPRSRRP